MSCLKPGDSLKIPSKAFDQISNEIKKQLQNKTETFAKIQYIPSTSSNKKISNEKISKMRV